jgi:hypothetical protein
MGEVKPDLLRVLVREDKREPLLDVERDAIREACTFHIRQTLRDHDPNRVAMLMAQALGSSVVVGEGDEAWIVPFDAPQRIRQIMAEIPGSDFERRTELLEEARRIMAGGKEDGMNQTQRDADRVAEVFAEECIAFGKTRGENPGSRDAATPAEVRVDVSMGPRMADGVDVFFRASFPKRPRSASGVARGMSLTTRDNIFGLFEVFLAGLRHLGHMCDGDPVDVYGDERTWQRAKLDVGHMHARDYSRTVAKGDYIKFGSATFWRDPVLAVQKNAREHGKTAAQRADLRYAAGVDHGSKDGSAVSVVQKTPEGFVVLLTVWRDGAGCNMTMSSGGIRAVRRVDMPTNNGPKVPYDWAQSQAIGDLIVEMRNRLPLPPRLPMRLEIAEIDRSFFAHLFGSTWNGDVDSTAAMLMKNPAIAPKPGDRVVCSVNGNVLVVVPGPSRAEPEPHGEPSPIFGLDDDDDEDEDDPSEELAESEEDLAMSIFRRRLRGEAEAIVGSREWSNKSATRQAPHGGKGFRHPSVTLPDALPALVVPARPFREEVERVFAVMWEKTKLPERKAAELEAEEVFRELGDLLLVKAKLGK